MPDTIAPKDHNRPPEVLPVDLISIEVLGEHFAAAIADVNTRIGDLRVAYDRIPTKKVVTGKDARGKDIEDDVLDVEKMSDVAEKVTTLLGQTRLALEDLEKVRVEWREPFRRRADAIQEAYKGVVALVETHQGKARRLLGAYQAQIQRQQQEAARAAKAKAEAEAAAAAAEAKRLEEQAAELARNAQTDSERLVAARTAEQAVEAATAVEKAEKKVVAASHADTSGHVRTAGALAQKPRTQLEITVEDSDVVPRAYCSVDMAKLREAIEAGVTKIPGVTWKQVPLATVKTR